MSSLNWSSGVVNSSNSAIAGSTEKKSVAANGQPYSPITAYVVGTGKGGSVWMMRKPILSMMWSRRRATSRNEPNCRGKTVYIVLFARVSALSTFTWRLRPSGHSGTFDPSGKKHAFPEKMPTSSRRMSALKTPGSVSASGMSVHARASGVSPLSVSAMISRRRTRARPMFVRNAARPLRGVSSVSVTESTSPRHLRRKDSGAGVCVISSERCALDFL